MCENCDRAEYGKPSSTTPDEAGRDLCAEFSAAVAKYQNIAHGWANCALHKSVVALRHQTISGGCSPVCTLVGALG
jgi:hypothetical protein